MVGLPPTTPTLEPLMVETLEHAHRFSIFTKGNLARTHANPIAEAACRGWLTVETAPGIYGNRWLVTSTGLAQLEEFQRSEGNMSAEHIAIHEEG